ncbi:MAG: DUF4340 domain-containing protein [Oligoflexales bacterium]|nr:DUF4340 domain-containing protein [Oligoflexales bacterium]
MNRRSWFIVAFLVLLGMSLIAYWDEWKTEQELVEKQSKNRLKLPKKGQISQLTFYHRDENQHLDASRFTKVRPLEHGWEIVNPVETFADDRAVNTFLKNMNLYQYEKTLANKASEFSLFGIDRGCPDFELEYRTQGGKLAKWRIYLGHDAPVGYMVYFTIDAQKKVYIGSKHLALMLKKSPFDLREKRPLKPWLQDLTELKLIRKAGDPMHFSAKEGAQGFKKESGKALTLEQFQSIKRELEKVAITEFVFHGLYQKMLEHYSKEEPLLSLYIVSKSHQRADFQLYFSGVDLVGFNTKKKEVFKLPIASLRYFDKSFTHYR